MAEWTPYKYLQHGTSLTILPGPEYAGNAPGRVPYIGYDMNSVLYRAEGISNYNALQLQARKRLSNGLQFTASYTWSHALDEQSGLGLFFTGNNPLDPKSNYASADFDQTHVFLINYSYTLPKVTSNQSLGYLVNGWTIGGQTVAQSGQPYSVYDYSGSVASLYYGSSDYITNPIVPLLPGVTAKQAELQGTTGVNANNPVLNAADFGPQFVAPGTNGVPPCDASGCDMYESLYGSSGRNLFRAPVPGAFRYDPRQGVPVWRAISFALQLRRVQSLQSPRFRRAQQRRRFLPVLRGAAVRFRRWAVWDTSSIRSAVRASCSCRCTAPGWIARSAHRRRQTADSVAEPRPLPPEPH
jgi:hypothetical protein